MFTFKIGASNFLFLYQIIFKQTHYLISSKLDTVTTLSNFSEKQFCSFFTSTFIFLSYEPQLKLAHGALDNLDFFSSASDQIFLGPQLGGIAVCCSKWAKNEDVYGKFFRVRQTSLTCRKARNAQSYDCDRVHYSLRSLLEMWPHKLWT